MSKLSCPPCWPNQPPIIQPRSIKKAIGERENKLGEALDGGIRQVTLELALAASPAPS